MAPKVAAAVVTALLLVALLASSAGVVAIMPVKCPTHNAREPICSSLEACAEQCGNEGYHFGFCDNFKCYCVNCSSPLDAKRKHGTWSP